MKNYIVLMRSIILCTYVDASDEQIEINKDGTPAYFDACRMTISNRLDEFKKKKDLQADDYEEIRKLLSLSDAIRSIEAEKPLPQSKSSDGFKRTGHGIFSSIFQWMKRK